MSKLWRIIGLSLGACLLMPVVVVLEFLINNLQKLLDKIVEWAIYVRKEMDNDIR